MEHNSINGHTTNGGNSGGEHQRQSSMLESTVGDSFVLVGANDVLEQYRAHLPRRKGHRTKVAEGCGGLSCASWFFLFLSLMQFLAVSGIQITIAVLGRFTDDRLPEYVECLQTSLISEDGRIPENFSISGNSTFPRFGEDKAIYVYFFIALVLYNFGLCVYAMTQKNIVEVYAFMVLNILAMGYACLQVYQFRGFGIDCEPITFVGYLAMSNVFILLIFTALFGLLSLTIYVEFGWKTYRLLNCNPAMRYYYRVYQILMSLIKIVILFLLMFTVGQCILILTMENYEWGITVVLSFVILVLAYPIIYLVVTYEWRFGYVLMFVAAFVLVAYCVFKIVRFATLSCPLCLIRVEEVANQTAALLNATGLQGTNFTDTEVQALFALDRVEDFANLIMLGSLVLLFVLVTFVVFIHHLRFYNEGLKEYFDEQQPNMYLNKHCLKSCYHSGAYDVDDVEPNNGKKLILQKDIEKRHKAQASQSSTTRDSRLEETVNTSEPNFNEETYTVPEPGFNMAPPTVGVQWDHNV